MLKSKVTVGKTQADGTFSVLLGSADRFCRHQIQVEVSEAPTASPAPTLDVAIRSPAATDFVTLDGPIDMSGPNLLKTFGPVFAAEIRFTPTNFDADKTYNVIVTSGEGT